VDLTDEAAIFALQVGIVLLAAKIGAEVFERWLKQPAVLGELIAGVAIGPFALGSIDWPGVGRLFGQATAGGEIPIPLPLWVFAELAAVILLFVVGLETDFASFVRFGPTAVVVAIGGVIVPFVLGDVAAVASGLAPAYLSPPALFVGAALTATSVGVTARVLSDMGRLDSPEGITILGAAVFDDVIGILVLAVVVAIAQGGAVSALDIGLIGGKALGAWIVLTAILVLAAHRIAGVFGAFRSTGAALALAIGLALVSAFVAQSTGLAMIVGAFSAGIALSRTRLRTSLAREAAGVYHVLVPAFFVVIGMLVNIPALIGVLLFGTALSLLAIVGKIIGCSIPALALGFTWIGALRVGVGMIPRGEVALIIAGIGLATGAVDQPVFSVVVFMTFATTIVAPPLLVPVFRREGQGYGSTGMAPTAGLHFELDLPADLFDLFERHLLAALTERGFRSAGASEVAEVQELRRQGEIIAMQALRDRDGRARIRVESEAAIADWPAALASAVASAEAEVGDVLHSAISPSAGSS
jgi:Kef-type K+ transport system membrane component KefB